MLFILIYTKPSKERELMNKKIFLKAYCYQNLGDDLFVRILAKRYPQTLFYLPMQPRFADSFSDVPNVQPIKEGTLYTEESTDCLKSS
jgi:hypothetical protein